jgi:hypothetical protein
MKTIKGANKKDFHMNTSLEVARAGIAHQPGR